MNNGLPTRILLAILSLVCFNGVPDFKELSCPYDHILFKFIWREVIQEWIVSEKPMTRL
jgi:hypothetical protein